MTPSQNAAAYTKVIDTGFELLRQRCMSVQLPKTCNARWKSWSVEERNCLQVEPESSEMGGVSPSSQR